jgi:hypothetical protein
VDARGDLLLVTPYSLDANGIWEVTGWVRVLEATAPAAAVGDAVEQALLHSEGQRAETTGEDPLAPILAAAGVKSWSQYAKGLRSASVRRRSGTTTIVPMRNLGPRQGLTEMEGAAVGLDDSTAEEVGSAVLRSLGRAVVSDVGGLPYFGRRSAWLAARGADAHELARSLGLADVQRESWAVGLEAVERAAEPPLPVFVTQPIDGWTVAALPLGLVDSLPFDLGKLSQTFGEAQKFATHPVVDYREWQRWVDGAPLRRYCWIGESGKVAVDDGKPAQAEAGIARQADLSRDWGELRFPDENTVFAVAAEWSIDPTALPDVERYEPDGLLGYVATANN